MRNWIQSKTNFNVWMIYYLLLGIIQAMWTNMSAFPPLPLRLLMNAAVFFPMFFKKECVVFGIPFFMILRGQLGTDYQYLPDIHSYNIYIPLLLFLLLIHFKELSTTYIKVYAPLICLLIYMFIVDILGISDCGLYVINIFIALLFSLFVTTQRDSSILSTALILSCAILSVYYIVMYNHFLNIWDVAEGIERSGWNDPNYFSTLLGIGLLFGALYLLGFLKYDFILLRPIVLITIIIVTYMAIVLTASRAGFIASSIILFISMMCSRRRLSIFIVISLLFCICVVVMYRLGIFDTLMYRMLEQDNLDTGGGRTTIWLKVINNFENQPLLNQIFGAGYWHRAELSNGADMHNEFMAIWTDYGYVGVIIFVLTILSMLFNKYHLHRERTISVLYYLLMIMTLSPFQYVNVGFLLVWIFSQKLTSVGDSI